ncbi:hypothetical protein GLOTRDRAFT_68244 [Gloeophyllum trabeum ATCC 11539]|uniref:Uncharacterized protein n=1 Tax=Gloeophyllum trabeum (strain ATCC 11539 / FP-39264 / Madison 617) TaxID=670483 RepID=S7S3X5_GLOTA|nr:uncharacterized protein GLOTRDRAFT_68244 [Gloeophyllum trabeum ATCC 11539]EPQ60529.1 hypothetical protein GLOTRDRAFT_68244 [Gloeophyllum trabeum ATCC 11539]
MSEADAQTDSTPTLNVRDLLGLHPLSPKLTDFLNALFARQNKPELVPEIKSYPDAVYFNYYSLGLSLCFSPVDGYKPKMGLSLQDLQQERLVLDSIDLYNVPKPSGANAGESKSRNKTTTPSYSTYPRLPLILKIAPTTSDGKSRSSHLEIKLDTTGKQFVECLGEPDRKGGGGGPSAGSIGIWCEWSKDGIMVEFGGDEARGPKAWETGKDAAWKVITLFPPKS